MRLQRALRLQLRLYLVGDRGPGTPLPRHLEVPEAGVEEFGRAPGPEGGVARTEWETSGPGHLPPGVRVRDVVSGADPPQVKLRGDVTVVEDPHHPQDRPLGSENLDNSSETTRHPVPTRDEDRTVPAHGRLGVTTGVGVENSRRTRIPPLSKDKGLWCRGRTGHDPTCVLGNRSGTGPGRGSSCRVEPP